MRPYRFALRTTEPEPEYLGALALPDDSEALAFGQELVQDLVERAKIPPPLVVEVIEGDRTVGEIPFR